MGRRERLPELEEDGPGPLREALAAVGGTLARNPTLVGGTTAFVVALSYVSANAIWYQPHFHSGAFFATRDTNYVGPPAPDTEETTIRIERQETPEVVPTKAEPAVEKIELKADPVVLKVQAILQSMNFYQGTVDGVDGPNTRKAVEAYRKTIGIAPGGIDDVLLEALGVNDMTAGIRAPAVPPAPEPRPETISAKAEAPVASGPDPVVMKIQAGLKAFGNDDMEVDGVMGAKTRGAIREFQSLFGLPVTGEPSEELYAKMREVGLTN